MLLYSKRTVFYRYTIDVLDEKMSGNMITEEVKDNLIEAACENKIAETLVKTVEIAIDDEMNFTKPDVGNLLSALKRIILSVNKKFEILDDTLKL